MDENTNTTTDHTEALDTQTPKPEDAHRNLVAQVLGIAPKLDDEESGKDKEPDPATTEDPDKEEDIVTDDTKPEEGEGGDKKEPEPSDTEKDEGKKKEPSVKVKKSSKKDPFTPEPVSGQLATNKPDKQPQLATNKPDKQKEDKNIGFSEEERAELEIWEYGEEKEIASKGITDQMRTFFRERKEKLAKLAEENHDDPEYDPKNDRSYQRWVSTNRPNVTAQQRAKIEREQIIDMAQRRAEEKFEKKIKDLESRQFQSEVKPAIERQVKEYQSQLMEAVPEEVMAHWKESQDFDKTTEEFPIEAPVAAEEIRRTTAVAQEFLAIRKGLKLFSNADENHKFIFEFINTQANIFLQKGGDKLVRNGKKFVHPYDYKPDDATTWTFDDGQVLSMLSNFTKRKVQARIEQERERVKKYAKYYSGGEGTEAKTKKDSEKSTGKDGAGPADKASKPSTAVKPGMGSGALKSTVQETSNPVGDVLGLGRR